MEILNDLERIKLELFAIHSNAYVTKDAIKYDVQTVEQMVSDLMVTIENATNPLDESKPICPICNKPLDANHGSLPVRTFKLHWLTGEPQIISGPDLGNQGETLASAMNNAGIGGGALGVIDYWEELYENE